MLNTQKKKFFIYIWSKGISISSTNSKKWSTLKFLKFKKSIYELDFYHNMIELIKRC